VRTSPRGGNLIVDMRGYPGSLPEAAICLERIGGKWVFKTSGNISEAHSCKEPEPERSDAIDSRVVELAKRISRIEEAPCAATARNVSKLEDSVRAQAQAYNSVVNRLAKLEDTQAEFTMRRNVAVDRVGKLEGRVDELNLIVPDEIVEQLKKDINSLRQDIAAVRSRLNRVERCDESLQNLINAHADRILRVEEQLETSDSRLEVDGCFCGKCNEEEL